MDNIIVKSDQKRFHKGISMWILAGAVIVLSPIFAYITLESINRQKENNIKLLVEKGAALIRSFEAGTRAGIFGYGETRQLQKLLYETAKQPDIKYLLVADINGRIIAHSDYSHTGDTLNLILQGKPLDLSKIAGSSDLYWQIVDPEEGSPFFLLFRRFSPSGGAPPIGLKISRFSAKITRRGIIDIVNPERIVVAAFDMGSVNRLEEVHVRNAVISGLVLFLAGITGVIFLFILQGYRTTRASLSNIRVFSSTLIENLPVGLMALDPEYNIVMTNHIAKTILALNHEAYHDSETSHEVPDSIFARIREIGEEERLIEENIECRLKNGKVIPLDVSISKLSDHENKPSGYICLFKDLSEVKALKKEVERSRRLASVGKLAAGVAHEIRNPLSSIKGFATYFKERYKKEPEDQQISDIMIQEVDRLNLVVGQLLEFARPVTLSLRDVELMPFFSNSIKLIEVRAESKKIQINKDLPAAGEQFRFDPDKISQVLLNLYINAIDAMDSGGTLDIRIVKNDVNGLEILIRDDGCGISEEDLNHVFDPYFTTKSSGTGLGLAISHNIIERHQGDISIDSRRDKGTTVILRLPETGEKGL